MWFKIIFIVLFGLSTIADCVQLNGVLSGNRMAGVPLGMSLGDGELDVEGICIEAGMTCLNCTHAITCIPLPVGWLKVPLERCPEDQTCNAHLGQCSQTAVPECDVTTREYKHTCEQIGIFPDAHDCRKFHLCSPPEDFPDGRPADHRMALCPRHYGYDPRTAQCSIPLKNGQCKQKPVPVCSKIGQSGPLDSSPNHYYVCLSKYGNLYPQIFICPHGWYFIDNFCHPRTEIISTEATTGTTTDTEATTGTTRATEATTETTRATEAITSTTVITTTTETNIPLESSKEESNIEPIRRGEDFFSTDKIQSIATDTFLADKIDLNNYGPIEDRDFEVEPDRNMNSFEFDSEFWYN